MNTKISIAVRKSIMPMVASSTLIMGSMAAMAAEPAAIADTLLDEVIVTAQFRAENLQDTPIAITAVSGEKLEEQGLSDVEDLGLIIPNANFRAPGAGNGPNASIGMRGVNTSEFIYTTDPGVGVYIDDVYHGTLSGSDMDLLDLERVEVLRGPQGTLFGKNSLGGAIRMISRKPKGDNSGTVEATYGTSDQLDLKASFDFAIADNLFMRIAGVSKQIDGYQDVLDFTCQMRVNGTPALAGTFPTQVPSNQQNAGDCKIDERGGSQLNAGRIMFRLLATEDLEFNLDADYSKTVAQAPVQSMLTAYDPASLNALYISSQPFGVVADGRFLTGDPFTTYANGQDPVDGKLWPRDQITSAWSTTGKVDLNITDHVHLKLIGAYRTYTSNWLGDGDDMPFDLNQTYNEQKHEQTTAEAQLSGQAFGERLDWTTGLYHYNSKSALGGYVTLPAFAIFNIFNFYQNDHFKTDSNSGFLHGVFKITEAMSLTAGARYTDESKTYAFDHTNFLTVAEPLKYGSNHFDWKLSLNYRFNPSLMVYGLASTGFRSDGAQPRPFTPGQQQTPTTAEEIMAYEIGLKSDFLGRRVRVNAAAFLNDYDPRVATGFGLQCNLFNDLDPGPIYQGIQNCPPSTPQGALFAANPTTTPGSYLWFFYTSAPGKAKGAELEVSATPVGGLDVNATLGFYTYKSSVAPTANGYIDPSYREQPRLSGSLGAQYMFRMAGGGSLTPRLDMFHQGERTNGAQNVEQRKPDNIVPSYRLVNARLTYMSGDGKWSAALAASNLFDKFYWTSLGAATLTNGTPTFQRVGTPGRGREISFTLRRSF